MLAFVFSLLASADDRSISDRMNSARTTVGLLSSNPTRSISVLRAAPARDDPLAQRRPLRASRSNPQATHSRRDDLCGRFADRILHSRALTFPSRPPRSSQSDSNDGKLSWSAFRGAFKQDVGDVQAGVTLNQARHAEFFETASVAKRVMDSDNMKLDAQLTHDFADKATKLEASLLTKNGVRIGADVDRNLKVGRIDISKEFTDVPLSRQLGDRLTISPSFDVAERELTVEVAQDVGSNNVVLPSATVSSDGALSKWGIGWMSRLSNGDAVHAQVDPESAKVDLRYDRACDDGSAWRLKCNVPSLTSENALSNTAWSVTRAWQK